VDFDVVELAGIVVFSTPEQDPVRFSTQWSEMVRGDRVLIGETVGGLTFEDRDIISVVSFWWWDCHCGIGETSVGPVSSGSVA